MGDSICETSGGGGRKDRPWPPARSSTEATEVAQAPNLSELHPGAEKQMGTDMPETTKRRVLLEHTRDVLLQKCKCAPPNFLEQTTGGPMTTIYVAGLT